MKLVQKHWSSSRKLNWLKKWNWLIRRQTGSKKSERTDKIELQQHFLWEDRSISSICFAIMYALNYGYIVLCCKLEYHPALQNKDMHNNNNDNDDSHINNDNYDKPIKCAGKWWSLVGLQYTTWSPNRIQKTWSDYSR